MITITEQYRQQNAMAHAEGSGYGVRGYKHLDPVLALAAKVQAKSVLDYGCGQATLEKYAKRVSPLKFASFDPAVEKYAEDPAPADVVVCTDVLEHVEPMCLHGVMSHLAELTDRAVYLSIATRPAKRILPDGRNAHLLVREPIFWFETVSEYFDIVDYHVSPGHSVLIIGYRQGEV